MTDSTKPLANDTVVPSAVEPPPVPKPRPWGFWATFGFGVLTVVGAFAAAFVVFGICMFFAYQFRNRPIRINADPEAVWIELVALLAMSTAGIALILLFARLRKRIPVAEYLGLVAIRPREMWLWLVVAAVVGIGYLTTSAVFGLTVNFEVDSAILPIPSRLSWLTEIVAVPIFSVFLFQGFLLPGFCNSVLGRVGGAVFMMILWTALWYTDGVDVAVYMAILGTLLTCARLQTGSTLVPCAMYVAERCLAMTAVVAFKLPVS